jgi:hypothetical protein
MDYKSKYLKYKSKYKSIQGGQIGGKIYHFMRKTDQVIEFPNGFSKLNSDGYYDLTHEKDENIIKNDILINKIKKLQDLVKTQGQFNADYTTHEKIALQIYNSPQKALFIQLVKWLNEPTNQK